MSAPDVSVTRICRLLIESYDENIHPDRSRRGSAATSESETCWSPTRERGNDELPGGIMYARRHGRVGGATLSSAGQYRVLDPTVYCEEPVAFPDMWSGLLVVARQDIDDSQPYDLMLQQYDISTLECFGVLSRKGAAEISPSFFLLLGSPKR